MNRLNKILIKVLEVEESEISDELSPETVETWDSFNGLVLVSELETGFGVSFTMDEVRGVKNVGDIKNALRRHGITDV